MQKRHAIVAAFVAVSLLTTFSRAHAQTLDIPFAVSKPPGDGPFPAVVLLHDCSGLGSKSSGAPRRWSVELTARGYVTIWPDSFSTRGFPGGVCNEQARSGVGIHKRADDAYAALAYLRTLPFVDASRVAVMGGSNGGASTLATVVASSVNKARATPGFAAAIAFYPSCQTGLGDWKAERSGGHGSPVDKYSGVYKPLTPTLILIGAIDDWTPADACRRMVDASRAAGYPIDIKVYPGAYHSFDSPSRVRFDVNRFNFGNPGHRGATTGGNPEAWADARTTVRDFLAKNLAARSR